MRAQHDAMRAAGFDPTHLYVDAGETAEATAGAALDASTYSAVVIGAGVRILPPLILFELLANLVHRKVPQPKLVF